MCKHCEALEVIHRLNRVTSALDGGGNINAEAIRGLLGDARDSLTTLFRALLAQKLILTGLDEQAIREALGAENTPPPGGLH